MATKAYILIKVKAGRTKDVLQSLKRLPGSNKPIPVLGGRTSLFSSASRTNEPSRMW